METCNLHTAFFDQNHIFEHTLDSIIYASSYFRSASLDIFWKLFFQFSKYFCIFFIFLYNFNKCKLLPSQVNVIHTWTATYCASIPEDHLRPNYHRYHSKDFWEWVRSTSQHRALGVRGCGRSLSTSSYCLDFYSESVKDDICRNTDEDGDVHAVYDVTVSWLGDLNSDDL